MKNGTVVVCGGGLTGVEAATEFAERHPSLTVRLITRGERGGWLSAKARRHMEEAFDRLGIQVLPHRQIAAIEDGAVRLPHGTFLGMYAPDALAAQLGGRVPKKKFAFRYIHQCISLGRRDAVIQFVDSRDESPRSAVLTGRKAVWYKNVVLDSALWTFKWPGPYLPKRRTKARAATRGSTELAVDG